MPSRPSCTETPGAAPGNKGRPSFPTDLLRQHLACPQLCSGRKCLALTPPPHTQGPREQLSEESAGSSLVFRGRSRGTSSATCEQGQMFLLLRIVSPEVTSQPGAQATPWARSPPTQQHPPMQAPFPTHSKPAACAQGAPLPQARPPSHSVIPRVPADDHGVVLRNPRPSALQPGVRTGTQAWSRQGPTGTAGTRPGRACAVRRGTGGTRLRGGPCSKLWLRGPTAFDVFKRRKSNFETSLNSQFFILKTRMINPTQ